MEATLVLAHVLHAVRLDRRPGRAGGAAARVTLRPQDGLRMRVTARG